MLCLVAQSCLTLYNPMDCSLPGSSVYWILQARILVWVAIPFSKNCLCLLFNYNLLFHVILKSLRVSILVMKEKLLSCVSLFVIPWTVVYQAPLSMGFSRQQYWNGSGLGQHWSGLPFPSPVIPAIVSLICFFPPPPPLPHEVLF